MVNVSRVNLFVRVPQLYPRIPKELVEYLLFNISVNDPVGDDPDDNSHFRPFSLLPKYQASNEDVLLDASEEELQRVYDHFGSDVSRDVVLAALIHRKPGSWFCAFNGPSGRCDIYPSVVQGSRYLYEVKDSVSVANQTFVTDDAPDDENDDNNHPDDDLAVDDDMASNDSDVFSSESSGKDGMQNVTREEPEDKNADEVEGDCAGNQGKEAEDVCEKNQGDETEHGCEKNRGEEAEDGCRDVQGEEAEGDYEGNEAEETEDGCAENQGEEAGDGCAENQGNKREDGCAEHQSEEAEDGCEKIQGNEAEDGCKENQGEKAEDGCGEDQGEEAEYVRGKNMAPDCGVGGEEEDVENARGDNNNADDNDECLNLVSLFGDISLT